MSEKKNVWTGPHPEGGWANRIEGKREGLIETRHQGRGGG